MPWQQTQAEPAEARPKPPDKLRPYLFHGLDLDWLDAGTGDPKEYAYAAACPWCGREDAKFSVTADKGTWGCWVCGETGNELTFLRRLWDESDKATNGESKAFAAERGLLWPETLTHWGVVRSVLDGSWLVPGFDPAGKLCQLYKRIRAGDKDGRPRWELRPTPTLPHALHGVPFFDPTRPNVHLHESWGNALAFWETLRTAKPVGAGDEPWSAGLEFTASEGASLLESANVLAVANCGAVGEPLRRYLPLLAGKRVFLWFDSDHPLANGKDGAGLAAAKRVAALFASSRIDRPDQVFWMPWKDQLGHDPALKSGFDVRDALDAADQPDRVRQLAALLQATRPIPEDWIPGRSKAMVRAGGTGVEAKECRSWKQVLASMHRALHVRQSISDTLAVMLAVAASTSQQDDQLFLQVIGDAGSAKTRLCDAMLTSRQCFALEHLTGFHSGWRDSSGEDFSLLSRINHKTLITPEGDVLMSSPHFAVVMSQQRRIFDGTSGASYKNRKEDLRYTGLRTPWIIAGTPALMDADQSRLGDRFLKVWIDPPDADGKREIMRRAAFAMMRNVMRQSNGDETSTLSPETLEFYRLTGGYVDHLRAEASDLLARLSQDDEAVVERCSVLADFTAHLRARPCPAHLKREEAHDTKELPSRLVKQFVRLAMCLAVTLNKRGVDSECLRIVRKVAIDSARGRTMGMVRHLFDASRDGASCPSLALLANKTEAQELAMLQFLARIDVAEHFKVKVGSQVRYRWRLRPAFRRTWELAMREE